MIISASRRTDIPAFYAEWFMNRIRAGYCTVPNPFNLKQISYISLKPEDVDVIVFWTRYGRPLLPHLAELDRRGYRYYFLYTLMNNPKQIDPKSPSLETSLETFREISDRIGKEKLIWRYDPIVISTITSPEFHQRTYQHIAEELKGYTTRSVISVVDIYRKVTKRLRTLASEGVEIIDCSATDLGELLESMSATAKKNGMEIHSCAEELDLKPYGIQPGKCIDDEYIKKIFSIDVSHKKDPSQRGACGCVTSRDIGMYDSCLFGCVYCYATTNFDSSRTRHREHKATSPSLIGWYEAKPENKIPPQVSFGV
jgi:hypothetical protein